MNNPQANAFQHLLAAWRRRDDARRSGSFGDLAQARIALDNARSDLYAHGFGNR
ncbi:MAG TPA: hypothetical protein VMM60_12335 [Ilumatobacter sp.]|nr:hypothetical protein [Ilumatobacter sp.]